MHGGLANGAVESTDAAPSFSTAVVMTPELMLFLFVCAEMTLRPSKRKNRNNYSSWQKWKKKIEREKIFVYCNC